MIGAPNLLSFVLLCGWPALAVALFLFMPARRALVVGFVIGWLFLPQMGLPMSFVKWDKHLVTSLGGLLGVLIFDTRRVLAFKPALVDLPMAVWCMVPFCAALSNGLEAYDGAAAAATQVVIWGVPYVLGRLYFADAVGLRGLAVWLFVAGVIYVPFCLFECILSPQLHFLTYGFYQHDFSQVVRMGGWRPMVYLQHGLAVGMLMTGASLAGVWLWWTGSLKRIWGMPVGVPLVILMITAVAVKSSGAIVLLLVGVVALFVTRAIRNYALVVVMCVFPFVYMGARSVAGWDAQDVLQFVAQNIEPDRALSLQCRLDNEKLLLDKAMKKPLFGWGPNGRNLVTADDGTILSIPDGLWVIAIGSNGIVGLLSLFCALLLPVALVGRRFRAASWGDPMLAGAAVFAVLLTLHSMDNLMNAMLNPIFILGLGGLAGAVAGGATAPIAARRSKAVEVQPIGAPPRPRRVVPA